MVSQHVDASPTALRGLIRAEPRGGAQSPFAATVLWERVPGAARRWENAPVLAVMLNGAQGDDDEAHGGHFALVTGRVGPDGAIGDWLANNFYSLDLESEKGDHREHAAAGQLPRRPQQRPVVVSAVVPARRGACATIATLARSRARSSAHTTSSIAISWSTGMPTMNCASISVDVLRALGWRLPERGATSWPAAWLGFPWFALRNRSLAKAAQSFDYLTEDRTRLLPAVAFEEIGADLLQMAAGTLPREPSPIEAMLAADLEAILLPAHSAAAVVACVGRLSRRDRVGVRRRVCPAIRRDEKIIPVPARPFPERLRDPDLLPVPPARSERAIAVWAALSVVGIPWLLWRWWRRAQATGASSS